MRTTYRLNYGLQRTQFTTNAFAASFLQQQLQTFDPEEQINDLAGNRHSTVDQYIHAYL
jgi:hypothetical protein